MQMILVLLAVVSSSTLAFTLQRSPSSSMALFASDSEKKWPGDRLPVPNPLFLDQKMDAAWGRGKYRTEIWDDNVNPLNDWYNAYTFSQEEIDAIRAGFDFNDAEGWCKSKGIDYEKAYAEMKASAEKQLEEVRACYPLFALAY